MLNPLTLLLVMSQLHQVLNTPLYKRASDTKTANDLPIVIASHQAHHIQQIFKPTRQKKGPSIPVIPIPHHLLLHANLHVIPAQSNVLHSAVHTNVNHVITKDNIKIPVLTQTISHSTTNVTHPTQLILIPIHHNLVQVHDLSVIPLQSNAHKAEKFGQFRVTEKKEEEHEEQNRYRTYYGGFGNGLFFGGHGAGHGFYHAYGK